MFEIQTVKPFTVSEMTLKIDQGRDGTLQ